MLCFALLSSLVLCYHHVHILCFRNHGCYKLHLPHQRSFPFSLGSWRHSAWLLWCWRRNKAVQISRWRQQWPQSQPQRSVLHLLNKGQNMNEYDLCFFFMIYGFGNDLCLFFSMLQLVSSKLTASLGSIGGNDYTTAICGVVCSRNNSGIYIWKYRINGPCARLYQLYGVLTLAVATGISSLLHTVVIIPLSVRVHLDTVLSSHVSIVEGFVGFVRRPV